MFPLGIVLLPHMPLPLRVFEPRYKQMLADIAGCDRPEFGVVLIERGYEVGGGDERFAVGTVARVVEVGSRRGEVVLTAVGDRRIEVQEWLVDDPYPRARVRSLPPLAPKAAAGPDLVMAELEVRAALDMAAEVGAPAWPAGVELSQDPDVALWQLCAVAPLSPMDHQELLCLTSARELVAQLRAATKVATVVMASRRAGDFEAPPDVPPAP